jgi:hypothetical protein
MFTQVNFESVAGRFFVPGALRRSPDAPHRASRRAFQARKITAVATRATSSAAC